MENTSHLIIYKGKVSIRKNNKSRMKHSLKNKWWL